MLHKVILFVLCLAVNCMLLAQRYTCDSFAVSIEIQHYTCNIDGYVSALGVSAERAPYTYQFGKYQEHLTEGAYINLSPIRDSLYVTDRSGCMAIFEIEVKDSCNQQKIKIHNSMTPNNDGIDDKWIIVGWEEYEDIEISVYNQRGQRVYHAFDYSIEWDGTILNLPAPEGAYFYLVKLDRYSPRKEDVLSGSLTLIR